MGMTSWFEKDLEFVQLLCNPNYLKWLFQNNYFSNEEFKKYLKRLLYFDKKEFKKFLHYPQCIEVLKRLLKDDINEILADDNFYSMLENQQLFLWRNRK